MKSTLVKLLDYISVLCFIQNFKTAFDNNSIYGGASMWLFQHFTMERSKAAFSFLVTIDNMTNREQVEI